MDTDYLPYMLFACKIWNFCFFCRSREIALTTRNKSNASFEALQYWQDLLPIIHYEKRTHFPIYTRCSENHNNTCAENGKIHGLKFDTL